MRLTGGAAGRSAARSVVDGLLKYLRVGSSAFSARAMDCANSGRRDTIPQPGQKFSAGSESTRRPPV